MPAGPSDKRSRCPRMAVVEFSSVPGGLRQLSSHPSIHRSPHEVKGFGWVTLGLTLQMSARVSARCDKNYHSIEVGCACGYRRPDTVVSTLRLGTDNRRHYGLSGIHNRGAGPCPPGALFNLIILLIGPPVGSTIAPYILKGKVDLRGQRKEFRPGPASLHHGNEPRV